MVVIFLFVTMQTSDAIGEGAIAIYWWFCWKMVCQLFGSCL